MVILGAVLCNPGVRLVHPVVMLGHPGVILGHPVVMLGHPRVILGYPRVLLGHLEVILGPPRVLWVIWKKGSLKKNLMLPQAGVRGSGGGFVTNKKQHQKDL